MKRLFAGALAVAAMAAVTFPQNVVTDLAGRGGTGGCPTFSVLPGGSTFFLDPLAAPGGVAVDPSGKLFVSTSSNCVWRLDADGLLRVGFPDSVPFRIGSGTSGFSDGDGATALLSNPMKLTLDASGNLFIADASNHRVRKVNLATWTITTVAGGGSLRPIDGINATDASFLFPTGVAVDPSGNLYVSDTNASKVFKVDSNGILTRFAGSGAFTYNGENIPATSSGMIPMGIASDAFGDIFIADWSNSIVRKVTPDGNITTVAGNPFNSTFLGDGGPAFGAALNKPRGVSVDASGNLLIADTDNHRIRMVDATGTITTIAGNGTPGATDRQLNFPTDVAADNLGNVFIADTANNMLRGIIVSTRTYRLSLNAAGTGSGALTGAGSYIVGQFVPVSATGGAGSTFVNWTGPNAAECAEGAVLMDADKSCTATFTALADSTPPVLSGVPAPFTVNATVSTGTVVTYALPTATDPDDAAGPVTCTPSSGSTFAIGTSTVTCSSSDTHGNTGSASFDVTVVLVSAPISIQIAEPIAVADNANPNTAPVILPVSLFVAEPITVADNASPNTAPVVLPVSLIVAEPITVADNDNPSTVPVILPVALILVEPIAVTDAPGADAVPVQVPIDVVLSERIAVTDLPSVIGDTTPPVIFVPPSMTIEATSPGGAVVRFGLPTAKDPDDSAGPVTCAPQSGSTFPIGTETVTCTSVDTHGNVGSATFFVTVADTTPPILRLPPTITVDATSAQGAAVTYVASAVDAVSGMVPVTCGRVAGSRFPIGVTSVTCSASDGAGNVTKGAFDVVVLNPAQMIANLISAVRGQQQVLKLLQSAAASITQNDVPAACGQLTGFANQVSAQTGHGFSVAQAADLLGHAADIKATLGCR